MCEHSRGTRVSVACRDKDDASGCGWWEQISCLMGGASTHHHLPVHVAESSA